MSFILCGRVRGPCGKLSILGYVVGVFAPGVGVCVLSGCGCYEE